MAPVSINARTRPRDEFRERCRGDTRYESRDYAAQSGRVRHARTESFGSPKFRFKGRSIRRSEMSVIVRALGLLVAIIFLSSLVANTTEAQVVKSTFRTIGVLPGSGYHVKESLTDSSYYSPYSAANSVTLTGVSGSSVYGMVSPGYSNSHNLEFGSYPGNVNAVDRSSTPRWFRWNSPTRGW